MEPYEVRTGNKIRVKRKDETFYYVFLNGTIDDIVVAASPEAAIRLNTVEGAALNKLGPDADLLGVADDPLSRLYQVWEVPIKYAIVHHPRMDNIGVKPLAQVKAVAKYCGAWEVIPHPVSKD